MYRYLVLPIVGLTACNDTQLNPFDDLGVGDGPAVEVEPSYVDFGELHYQAAPIVQQFTIFSVGDTDLLLEKVTLDEGSASFQILTDIGSTVLPPGASTREISSAARLSRSSVNSRLTKSSA